MQRCPVWTENAGFALRLKSGEAKIGLFSPHPSYKK